VTNKDGTEITEGPALPNVWVKFNQEGTVEVRLNLGTLVGVTTLPVLMYRLR
jgi:hypothetical protein